MKRKKFLIAKTCIDIAILIIAFFFCWMINSDDSPGASLIYFFGFLLVWFPLYFLITYFYFLENKKLNDTLFEQLDPIKTLELIEENRKYNRAGSQFSAVADNLAAVCHMAMGNDQLAGEILTQTLSGTKWSKRKSVVFRKCALQHNLLFVLLRSGRTQDADRLFEEIKSALSSLKPTKRLTVFTDGFYAYWDSQRYGRHDAFVQTALRELSNPSVKKFTKVEYLLDLGKIAQERGETEKARKCFSDVVALAPHLFAGTDAKQRLEKLQGVDK